MRRSMLPLLVLPAGLVVGGCAHSKDQYAYAYPAAPPVYTQPAGYATPAIAPASSPLTMPAPVGALPAGAVVAAAAPPSARAPESVPVGAATMPGSVASLPPGAVLISDTAVHASAIADAPCPPMTTHAMAADGTLMPIAGDPQTAPCPQEFVSEVVVPEMIVR